ncbi:DUF3927 family protein [Escherichia coli]|nr:DUF3927 family protein [Escherichia coli]
MTQFRWIAAAVLLFLVIITDFTSRFLSVLADGVLVIGVVYVLWPIFWRKKDV